MKRQLEKEDEELNRNNDRGINGNNIKLLSKLEEKFFKVPLPVAGIFIAAGFFILTFSFVVNVKCPKDNLNCGEEYLGPKRAQKLSPMLISYGFLFISLLSWYFFYYWWDTKKKQKEASVMRIASDHDSMDSEINSFN
jgi:hypothetical protein